MYGLSMETDPYALLGVGRKATAAEIKDAYRRCAKTAHPDCSGGSAARFEAVRQAYELLSDGRRRRFLDLFGTDPHTLGFHGDAINAAIAARKPAYTAGPTARVARADCQVCEGSGWRPSGRACVCDPEGIPASSASPTWDPTASAGSQRVRMKRDEGKKRVRLKKD